MHLSTYEKNRHSFASHRICGERQRICGERHRICGERLNGRVRTSLRLIFQRSSVCFPFQNFLRCVRCFHCLHLQPECTCFYASLLLATRVRDILVTAFSEQYFVRGETVWKIIIMGFLFFACMILDA